MGLSYSIHSPNNNGQDTLTYQICDSFDRCDTATALIQITDPN